MSNLNEQPRHKQPGRAEYMRGIRRKYRQKIQFLVQELGLMLEDTGSVSITSGTKSVLQSAISFFSGLAGEDGAHKFTLSNEATVESPLVTPPAVDAVQTHANVAAKTVVLPSILTAPPSMIIAPTMTRPVSTLSCDHPSLTPSVHMEISLDQVAEAMLELSKGYVCFEQ